MAVKQFEDSNVADQQHIPSVKTTTPAMAIQAIIPDQASANVVKKCLTDLSTKVKTTIQPVIISRKLNKDLGREVKPATVKQQCLVYKLHYTPCDAGYVGYTCGHLHEHVDVNII